MVNELLKKMISKHVNYEMDSYADDGLVHEVIHTLLAKIEYTDENGMARESATISIPEELGGFREHARLVGCDQLRREGFTPREDIFDAWEDLLRRHVAFYQTGNGMNEETVTYTFSINYNENNDPEYNIVRAVYSNYGPSDISDDIYVFRDCSDQLVKIDDSNCELWWELLLGIRGTGGIDELNRTWEELYDDWGVEVYEFCDSEFDSEDEVIQN